MENSLITLDWLSISVKLHNIYQHNEELNALHIGNEIYLQPTNRKTPTFNNIFQIIDNGCIIGDLQCNPKNGLLDIDHAIIKFTNELLYTDNLSDIYYSLKEAFKFKFYKFCQLDIALDTPSTDQKTKFMHNYRKGKIEFIGKPQVVMQTRGCDHIEYMRIGSRKSDKFVRIYEKRQELEISNKKYIADFWSLNGFNPDQEVLRTELSIKGRLLKRLELNDSLIFTEEDTINVIQDCEFLKSIFISETQKFCKYSSKKALLKAENRTDKVKQYYPFELDVKTATYLFKRIKDEVSKVIHKIKICSKFLHQIGIETGQRFYKYLSNELAEFEALETWKDKHVDRWEYEHRSKMKNPRYKLYVSNLIERLTLNEINFIRKDGVLQY